MDLVCNTTMKLFIKDNSAFHIPSDVFANTYLFTVCFYYINI